MMYAPSDMRSSAKRNGVPRLDPVDGVVAACTTDVGAGVVLVAWTELVGDVATVAVAVSVGVGETVSVGVGEAVSDGEMDGDGE